MESSKAHKLTERLGAYYHSDVILYDISGYSAVRLEVLTDAEMEALARFYYDGRCPVCATEINVGEVVCDGCFADAQLFPARADALTIAP